MPQYQRYIWVTLVVWTISLLSSLIWNIRGINENLLGDARLQALVAFNKDINYRRWNANHGGVYVKLGKYADPNPYLLGVAERDKFTTDGDSLTMINPAYMSRQFYELEFQKSGIRGHITSLNPIRPENEPDPWERIALETFEAGNDEMHSLEVQDNQEYFRFMRPLITEEPCLQCHSQQGYKLGDVRGGISISIPMMPLRKIAREDILRIGLAHVAIWLLGILGAVFSAWKMKETAHKKQLADEQVIESEKRYRLLAIELKESNDLQELLIDIITHDLTNPAGVIQSVSVMLNEEIPDNEMLQLIQSSSNRLMGVMENAQTLAQVSSGEHIIKEPHSIARIIKDVAKDFASPLKESGMVLSINLESELQAQVNPIISEIFVNYLSNAIKYASAGKQITIDAEENEDSFTIRVKDQGKTIPAENREKVFLRSFQLSNGEKRGRGLGLSIVKRIAAAHDADVWVEPYIPKGNSFCLRLPR
ncbi:MAG: DUF3365 domain-containing protein [Bacteroidia bacterium]|nr:DUF3365 domain-containing protein [Bacteroidia bacterium]